MKSSAIIAPPAFEEPNWTQLRALEPERAAAVIGVILKSLDAIEEKAFAVRGEAMLLIEERKLFRFVVDDEVGDYYQSFDKWLKDTLPRSWGYCRDALRTRKECREISYADYVQIPRCNSEQLKKVSSSLRALPAVVEAAQTLPEKAFGEKLNRDHAQHLEVKQPVALAPAGDVAEFESAIEMAMLVEHCDTRADAIKAIAVSYIQDHATEFEHLKEESA